MKTLRVTLYQSNPTVMLRFFSKIITIGSNTIDNLKPTKIKYPKGRMSLLLVVYFLMSSMNSQAQEYNCADGIDNDGDGLIDSMDPDCSGNDCLVVDVDFSNGVALITGSGTGEVGEQYLFSDAIFDNNIYYDVRLSIAAKDADYDLGTSGGASDAIDNPLDYNGFAFSWIFPNSNTDPSVTYEIDVLNKNGSMADPNFCYFITADDIDGHGSKDAGDMACFPDATQVFTQAGSSLIIASADCYADSLALDNNSNTIPNNYSGSDVVNQPLVTVTAFYSNISSFSVKQGYTGTNSDQAKRTQFFRGSVSDINFTDIDALPLAPAIAIQKSGPSQAYVGEEVTYTFSVTNDNVSGDGSPILNVSVTDNIVGSATYVSGDTKENSALDVGETWFFEATYTIQASDADPLINIGTVTGEDGEGDTVTDNDSHITDLVLPASISGNVSEDTNGDGLGNSILEGVLIELQNLDGSTVTDINGNALTTTTLSNGNYSFDLVPPGDYIIVQTDLLGYTSISDSDDTNDGSSDSDTNPNTNDNQISVNLVSGESDTQNNFIDAVEVSISGNVFNDADGMMDGIVDGAGTNAGGLFATLLDSDGNVVASTPILANGTYSIDGITPGSYSVLISTNDETSKIGNTPSGGPSLPSGWVNTGEGLGTDATSDGTIDGNQFITIGTSNLTNIDFGIEQPPVADDVSSTNQINPGGTTQVVVPTLDVADAEDGTPTTITISELPNAASEGTLYYDGMAITSGQVISNYDSDLLTLDPVNGDVEVDFMYTTTDAAGIESEPATVVMPFFTISLSGNVYHDADGLTDGIVDGTVPNAGMLFATLLDAGGNVVASVQVMADGSYSINGLISGDYDVQISTTDETNRIGSAPSGGSSLPMGWANTGEGLGTDAVSDGTINGSQSITLMTTNIENVDFGIQQPPTADDVTADIQPNPGGTVEVQVPPLDISDAEDVTPTTITIVTLPNAGTQGTLYYNGSPVTAGLVIVNYDSALLTVDPVDGVVVVDFTYTTTDEAEFESEAATVTLEFSEILPIVLTAFNGSQNGSEVLLNWTTATEINSSHFEVQYSLDGDNFVGFREVEGNGTSRLSNYYSCQHNDVLSLNTSKIYYRLKQVDLDDSYEYSEVIVVDLSKSISPSTVFPNPLHDSQSFTINGSDISNVKIYDMQGRLLLNNEYNLQNTINLSLSEFRSEMYIIVINNSETIKLAN